MDPQDELSALRWLRKVIAYRMMTSARDATIADLAVGIGATALHLWELAQPDDPPAQCDPIDAATGESRR